MSYTINFTDPSKPSFAIDVRDFNDTKTSITLYGKGAESYGEGLQEGILHILENFANPTEPANKIQGQLWFDNSSDELTLKVWDGTEWGKVGAGLELGTEFPDPAEAGMLFFNSDEKKLYVYDGAVWKAIAYATDLEDHLNDNVRHLSAAQITLLNGLTGVSAATITALQNEVNTKVSKAGDTMTDFLTLHSDPSAALHAATKNYVDTEVYRLSRLIGANGEIEYLHHESHTTFATPGQTNFTLPWEYTPNNNEIMLFIGGVRMGDAAFDETSADGFTLLTSAQADTEISLEAFKFGILNPPSTEGLNGISTLEYTEATGGTTDVSVPAYVLGSNNLMVWRNGIKRRMGAGADYTEVDATTIRFNNPLEIGDFLQVSVFDLVGGASIRIETLVATQEGQQQFTLTTPYILTPQDNINPENQDIHVFAQGVYQGKESLVENTGSDIVLATGVPVGESVEVVIFELT